MSAEFYRFREFLRQKAYDNALALWVTAISFVILLLFVLATGCVRSIHGG